MSVVSWRGPKRERGPEAELSFDHSAEATVGQPKSISSTKSRSWD